MAQFRPLEALVQERTSPQHIGRAIPQPTSPEDEKAPVVRGNGYWGTIGMTISAAGLAVIYLLSNQGVSAEEGKQATSHKKVVYVYDQYGQRHNVIDGFVTNPLVPGSIGKVLPFGDKFVKIMYDGRVDIGIKVGDNLHTIGLPLALIDGIEKNNPDSLYQAGKLAFERKDYSLSRSLLEQAIAGQEKLYNSENNPEKKKAEGERMGGMYEDLGITFMKLNRNVSAEEYFEKAIPFSYLALNQGRLYFFIGECNINLNSLQDALEAWKKAAQLGFKEAEQEIIRWSKQ
ncbi:hypothetical protein HYU13_01085 [Candidatus Woesearchaeota archaeon]|nr:hypothetical protein [Candidatus Woesearchaeota archaeon]